jgi:hypothetical protein
MNNFRSYLAWVSTFSLLGAPVGLEGCGSKDKEPVAAVQQASAGAQDAAAATPVSSQQTD